MILDLISDHECSTLLESVLPLLTKHHQSVLLATTSYLSATLTNATQTLFMESNTQDRT